MTSDLAELTNLASSQFSGITECVLNVHILLFFYSWPSIYVVVLVSVIVYGRLWDKLK